MAQVAGPTAALAGIPVGLQAQGVWQGRRQVFVRFAAEAETATMYTADALAGEIKRSTGRSAFHSVAIAGRDPLGNVEYLCAAFDKGPTDLPIMIDCDGQRPSAIGDLKRFLTLFQITLDGPVMDVLLERSLESLKGASEAGLQHALVLAPGDQTSDAQLLRVVEQAHAASETASVVIHPPAGVPVDRDRRWVTLMDRASALHGDVRFLLRLPPPTGMR